MTVRTPRLLLDLTPLDTPSGPRGIGRYIRELSKGLSELTGSELAGIEIIGLTKLGWGGDCETTSDLASFVGRRCAPASERDFYEWAYRQRALLWRAARHVGATAVHVTDPHATPLFLHLAGVRKIVTCHDLVPTRLPEHYFGLGDGGPFIGKRIERRRYRSADLVVAISDATRSDVRSLLGVREERVVRVYNGIDTERWASAPAGSANLALARFELGERPFVLYVGGSDWRKNVAGMMAGLSRAHALGAALDLVWAGHLEPKHRAAVAELATRAGVHQSVRYLGFVTDDELAWLYRKAVAHLFVSRLEGFGLTVVEAMASGCPVLTTSGGALGEVAGDAALTVDPEDHAAIGAGLARLVREPLFAQDLAARGRLRAPHFSRRAHALAMAQTYRNFFASQKPA